jgi:type II restriction/modification system DNA methylase subunit YeeA
MPPALTPQSFVAKWRKVALKESAAAKEHFLDLCRLLDHPTPAGADAEGTTFTFEYGAAKLGGGQGFADVFKRGFFGWEYKGKHANLDRAYQQLLQYRESLHNPPLLVVSDIDTIVVHPNFINRANRPTTLTLDDLLTPAGMAALRAVFTDPQHFESPETPESVTQRIATEFARIADRLRLAGYEPPRIAHFLIRLLFCLFAEDVELLPRGLFARLIERTRQQPAAFAMQLRQLFAAMAAGGWFGADEIKHFNGGLFEDDTALELDGDSMDVLVRVAAADWGAIEPSITGTLFERSLDPDKRSQLGAHYTSKEDILLIVEPVLMAPLRRRWDEVKAEVEVKAEQRDHAQGQKRANLDKKLRDLCVGFATELAQITVLDPACGSGNFLYLALRSLLDLWKEVYNLMLALGLTPISPLEGISPTPGQLHGIEINAYAHELAQATIWMGYIQWLRDNGFGLLPEPILKPIHTVQRMDAILTLTPVPSPGGRGVGERSSSGVREPDWPAADVIIGNPPFLGGGRIRNALGDAYTEDLFKLYDDRLPNFSDLCCYWFEKARAMIAAGKAKRAGLLATQGIRGGANRAVLDRIKQSNNIFWAQSDRNWILDGATVHVSMVGFDNGAEQKCWLDGHPVSAINSDLSASVDVTRTKRLPENAGLCFMGPSPKAPFDIEDALAQRMLRAPINVNGRPNSDVVRPVASGIDLVQQSRNKWTIDFGLMDEHAAAQYELPFEYAKTYVLPIRQNRRDDYRGQWWQYARPRPEMRKALAGMHRIIATPEVSKHRIFVWVEAAVLCNQQTLVFARDDDFFFGILHSRAHELWARRLGSQLREAESGFRYTPTTCFETFPFPWPPGGEPADDPRVAAIAQAARELVQLRDAWLNPPDLTGLGDQTGLRARTLTNLYNARPTWLDNAHRKLDAAVFAAYGWPTDPSTALRQAQDDSSGHDLTDEEILARLLALNLARATATT